MANGRYNHNEGYIETRKNQKRILEHRLVIEQVIGRELTKEEVIHHINGNKTDNRKENLEITNRSEHSKKHCKKTKYIQMICQVCGVQYDYPLRYFKSKTKNGQTIFVCSKHCVGQLTKKFLPHKYNDNIDLMKIIKKELTEGYNGYQISKKYKLNKRTVYNYINKLKSAIV